MQVEPHSTLAQFNCFELLTVCHTRISLAQAPLTSGKRDGW